MCNQVNKVPCIIHEKEVTRENKGRRVLCRRQHNSVSRKGGNKMEIYNEKLKELKVRILLSHFSAITVSSRLVYHM